MNFRFNPLILTFSVITLSTAVSCTPRLTILDRQTILEEEAAGDWPQFDQKLIQKGPIRGATLYPSTPMNAKKARLFTTLQGEMTQ